MASRRMISIKVVNSARFIKMPTSTQLLYFHLNLHGDDDGVVEAYPIMRMLNVTEDDLKILVAKEYVKVLNEDLVTYIMDWHEHNCIRADRKIDSRYQNLLIQLCPEVQLVEAKRRSDRKVKDEKISGTDNGRHRIGKDRIG